MAVRPNLSIMGRKVVEVAIILSLHSNNDSSQTLALARKLLH